MQCPVCLAYSFVAHSAVLQQVAVPVLIVPPLLPPGSHDGRCHGEVVFRFQVPAVIGLVHLLNVIQKVFKGLPVPVRIEQRGERLVQLMEGLEAGKDVIAFLEPPYADVVHGALTD